MKGLFKHQTSGKDFKISVSRVNFIFINVLLKYVRKQLETKYILWIDISPNFPNMAKAGVAESHYINMESFMHNNIVVHRNISSKMNLLSPKSDQRQISPCNITAL